MRISIIVLFLITFLSPEIRAQNTSSEKAVKRKGSLYFTWGYNKDWFSKSDLHFSKTGAGAYDFTIHDVKAEDRPNFDELFQKDLSIPQFIYRLGYYFKNEKYGVEVAFDHSKYIMIQDQVARVSGTIQESSIDKDTALTNNFVAFEHTNGANFLMLNFLLREQLLASKNQKHKLQGVLKPGAGIVIPQSDVSIFGKRQNNDYHIAGYIFGVEGDLRYELGKYLFLETGFKGVFANYTNVLTVDEAKANHSFFALEWLIGFGCRVNL
ncbi:MAG: hypothetical protein KA444_07800 [Bacteroidia bacterium]|nr:hypothetical protein [Bacteroidia bacterium]